MSEETAEKIKQTFKGLFSAISVGVNIVKSVVSGCVKLLGAILPIGTGLLDVGTSLGNFLTGMSEAANKTLSFSRIFDAFVSVIHNIATGIGKILSSLAGGIDKCGGVIGIVKKMVDVVGQLFDKVHLAMPGDSIFDTLFKLINGGIFTTLTVYIMRFMKGVKDASEGVGDILGSVGEALEAFTGSIKAEALKKIAIAVGILAASLFVLSLIDPARLTTALIAITALFGELMLSMSLFGKILDGNSFKGISKVTAAMIGISTALLILSAALKVLSTITWQEMLVGLGGMVVGLGALIGAVNLLPEKKVNNAAKALKKLSAAVVVFAVGLKILGSMSWQEMAVGLGGMVIGLGALVGALHLLPKDLGTKASTITTLAFAMVILGGALKIFATMSWQEMALGLGGMVIGLGALIGAVNLLPKDTAAKAGSVVVLASAMVILGGAIKILSSMSWQELVTGIGGMAVSLGVLVAALHLLPNNIAGKAAGILIISSAMVVLGAALKILGSMSVENLAKGIGAIAAVLVILGVAAYALSPVAPVLLAIGGAVALLGVGCLAAGAGLVLLATGLTALAAAIIGSVGIILAGANELVGVFTTIILSLVNAIVVCIPAITNGVLLLIVSVIEGLVQHTPKIVGLFFDFLINLINAIAEKIPDLIQAGVNLIMSFLTGAIDALQSIDPQILVNGIMAIGFISALMTALAAMALLAPAAMVGVLGIVGVLAEMGALAQIPGLQWIIGEGAGLLQTIGKAIGGFIGGFVGGIAAGLTDSLPQIADNLSDFMTRLTPFIEGASAIDASMLSGVEAIAGIVVALTAANILDGLTSWFTGGTSLSKFGEELASLGPYLSEFANSIGDFNADKVNAVAAAANAIKVMAEAAGGLPNEGGWLGAIVGDNSIEKFGGYLPGLGSNLAGFVENLGTFGDNQINTIDSAMTALSSISSLGNTNLKGINEHIEDIGSKLSGFAEKISGFCTMMSSISGDALTSATSKIYELLTLLDEVQSANIESLTTFGDSLETVAQNGISKFVSAFTSDSTKSDVKKAVGELVKGAADNIKTTNNYRKFKNAGKYLVEGLVEGIDKNVYKAEAAARLMARSVDEAVREELDINSPSVVMQKDGRYIVDGVAEGIKKNTSAEEAATKKAQNIVEAFKTELDKHDLNISMFDKDFELWSLTDGLKANDETKNLKQLELLNAKLAEQTVNVRLAYGEYEETKRYQAELGEDSAKKVQEALSKYKDELIDQAKLAKEISDLQKTIANAPDEILLASLEYKKELAQQSVDYRNSLGSDEITDELRDSTNLKDLNNILSAAQSEKELYEDKWNEFLRAGTQDTDEGRAAELAYLKALRAEEDAEDAIADELKKQQERRDSILEDAISERDRSFRIWELTTGKDASDEAYDVKYLEKLNADWADQRELTLNAFENYIKLVTNGFEKGSKEAQEAWSAYQNALIAENETKLGITNYMKSIQERENAELKKIYEIASDNADLEYQIWEKGLGENAADAIKDAKKLGLLNEQVIAQTKIVQLASQDYFEAVKEYGEASVEAKSAYGDYLQEQLALTSLNLEITNYTKEIQERENAELKESYEIASSNAELKYQIWEKTLGRDATNAEKDAKKLAILSEQASFQTNLIQLAHKDYLEAVKEYGDSSNEAQSAYNDYLQEQLNLANLQSDILDIEDKNKRRLEKQKRAKQDYLDYMKKYEKYYLDHGMTMEELERDAKLVSGYDPNASMNRENIISNFNKTGVSYAKALSNGVSETAPEVVNTTTTMVTTCLDKLKETKSEWVTMGEYLAEGLAEGIRSQAALIAEAVNGIANSAINTMSNAVDSMSSIIDEAKNLSESEDDGGNGGFYYVRGYGQVYTDEYGHYVNRGGEKQYVSTDTSAPPPSSIKVSERDAITAAVEAAKGASSSMNNGSSGGNNSNATTSTTSVNFTQNNYSPKAISPTESYRLGNNAMSKMKKLVMS